MALENTDLFVAYRPADQKHYKVSFSDIGTSYLPLAGGTLTGDLELSKSKKLTITKVDGTNQFQLKPNVGSAPYGAGDYACNFYVFNSGQLRIRSTLTDSTSPYTTHAIFGPKDHKIGDTDYTQSTKLSYVETPTAEHHAANKYYVDNRDIDGGTY